MYIALKKRELFCGSVNLLLHLIEQLMTVISSPLSAAQRYIKYLPCG